MKTISLCASSMGMLATLVRVLLVNIVVTSSIFGQSASTVSYTSAATPARTASGKAIMGLQVEAQPVENQAKVRVSFHNASGRPLVLEIKNDLGKTLYSKYHPKNTAFQGIFDLSQLGDGHYSLKINTLTKVGFTKQAYRKAFQIHSTASRRITPAGPDSPQALPAYQVRR